MKNNNILQLKKRGFVALPIVILVVVMIATAGGVGAYVYVTSQSSQQTSQESEGSSNDQSASGITSIEEPDNPVTVTVVDVDVTDTTPTDTTTPTEQITPVATSTSTPQPTVTPNVNVNVNNSQSVTVYVDNPRPGNFYYIDSELTLTARVVNGGIQLTWTRCNSDQFVAYKVSRSESNADVYFPRDGSIFSTTNQNALSYLDRSVASGKTYYYRICSLERNGESWCGNAVAVTYR